MKVKDSVEARSLALPRRNGDEWKGTELTWEIAPKDHGSVVQFRHANWREATHMFAMCNSSWGELIASTQRLGGGEEPWSSLDGIVQLTYRSRDARIGSKFSLEFSIAEVSHFGQPE